MTVLMSYKLGSSSAKSLAQELGIRRVRHNGDFRNNYNHKIINWGCSTTPSFPHATMLNPSRAVALAANKYFTLRKLQEYGIPSLEYTLSPTEAYQYLEEGTVVYARKTLTGRSGQGIIVLQPGDDMIAAPLYTKMFDKTREFRVHATKDVVFDYQAKLKRRGEEADDYVFSHDNGRVFCRTGIYLPHRVAQASVDCINALGLDFGAVDIGIDAQGNVAVFEVNSAPALEGMTLKNYVDMLTELLQY